MADISIVQAHSLSPADAKAAAQQVAERLAEEYGMALEWIGDVLRFSRAGVSGALTLSGGEARIDISLGPLFKVFAPTIEQKVGARMKKMFGAEA
jgi:putative polyhydroxyalkanoate system protein